MINRLACLAVAALSLSAAPGASPLPGPGAEALPYSALAAQRSHSRSSRLVYRDGCGWQGSGRAVYLQNATRSRSVVTVRQTCNCGRERWSRTRSYNVEPGAEQWVGCSRGDTAMEFSSFSIVGERAN